MGSDLFGEIVRYSFDTSAFIYAWHHPYRPDRFPSVWHEIDELMQKGILLAIDEVKAELSLQRDDLFRWIQQRRELFIPQTQDIQQEVKQILKRFPDFARPQSLKPHADPFVIALAKVQNCIVVTQEKGGSESKPKIL